MNDFDEQLAAAKAAPRPHKDVKVCLDANLATERERLLNELEAARELDAADPRLASGDVHAGPIQARLDALAVAAQASLVTLRFRRLPGDEWLEITSRSPVRIDVAIDLNYGYNYDGACALAATHVSPDGTRYAFRMEGDQEIPLEPSQWHTLASVLAGPDVSDCRDAIWALNQFEPDKRLNELVKGFGAATRSEAE